MYTQVEEASRVTQNKSLVFPLLGNRICQITREGYYAWGWGVGGGAGGRGAAHMTPSAWEMIRRRQCML